MKKSILFLTLLGSIAATALRGGLITGATPQQTFNHAVNQGYCSLYLLTSSPTISSNDKIYTMAPTDYRMVMPISVWGGSTASEQSFLKGIYADIQTAFAQLSQTDKASYQSNSLAQVGKDFLNALRSQWQVMGTTTNQATVAIEGGSSLVDDLVALFKNMGITLNV